MCVCENAAAEITKIEAYKQTTMPPAMVRMEQNFGKSMPLLRANAFLAALPGAHALGRVHSPHGCHFHMARKDGDAFHRLEQYFIAQRRGKSWRNGDEYFPKIFSQNR